jgi:hypothetical protein
MGGGLEDVNLSPICGMTQHHMVLVTIYTVAFAADIVGTLFAAKDVFRMVQHNPGLYDAI